MARTYTEYTPSVRARMTPTAAEKLRQRKADTRQRILLLEINHLRIVEALVGATGATKSRLQAELTALEAKLTALDSTLAAL